MPIIAQSLDNQLLNAVYNNNEKAVFELLRMGANPNAKTQDGVTPLMYAVDNGNLLIARKLLKSGANPNINSYYAPAPIITATIYSDTLMVYTLLDNGAKPDIIDSTNGMTPLLYAISKKNYEICHLLLDYGANPNLNTYNITPIDQAIYSKTDTTIIKLLIKYGANINSENEQGLTPLMLCIKYQNLQAAKILIQKHASCQYISSKNNLNAIEYAIKLRNKTFVNFFIHHCKKNLNQEYKTALKYDYQYAAKKIRQETKLKSFSPVFSNIIFSANTKFNTKDFFYGLQAGIKESRYNLELKIGFFSRIVPTKILLPIRQHYFIEYRESRIILNTDITKNITLFNTNNASIGTYLSLNYNISFGKYRGAISEIQNRYIFSPQIGFWLRKKISKYDIAIEYLPVYKPYPFYLSINYSIIIPVK